MVVKVITFVFFGQTQGFHIPNISQITSAGEFWEEDFCRFLFIKTLVIYSMIPSAVTAKLMKIVIIYFLIIIIFIYYFNICINFKPNIKMLSQTF